LCEEMDEVYQSLDDDDADDSLATEAAELQQKRQDWLSQIDFNKCARLCRNSKVNSKVKIHCSLNENAGSKHMSITSAILTDFSSYCTAVSRNEFVTQCSHLLYVLI